MKIMKQTNKQYTTFSQLRRIMRSLKRYGYEREGRSTYTFRTTNSMYIVHLQKV